jgi:hypothetical protein
LLHLCDTRAPSIDKLHYFSLETENSLMDYKGMLDDFNSDTRQDCSFLNSMHHLCWKGKPTTNKVAAYSSGI